MLVFVMVSRRVVASAGSGIGKNWGMQGVTPMGRDLWDAQEVAGGLVPKGSVFAFLAVHRQELFDEAFTADLFPSRTGRPSLPADLVGAVLVLKELYALSDSQTAEALKFDIRWKVACGRSLTAVSFDPSTLVYWRKRIAASDRPDRVFDKVAEVIAATGILKGRRKRCVDSTVFDDAVATQDTVTQLVAAIRRVARVVPGGSEVITTVCTLDYGKAGKPEIDWDDPVAKTELVSTLVNDALKILECLGESVDQQGDSPAADALGLLGLVAGQDVEPAKDSDGSDGRWVIARKVAADRVISTVDPQARHTRKSKSVRRDGYRGHVVSEPDTGLITDCEMTMATGEENTDASMGVRMANRDRFHPVEPADIDEMDDTAAYSTHPDDDGPGSAAGTPAGTGEISQDGSVQHDDSGAGLRIYGDSAYGSGAARAAYREGGHEAVIKPKPVRPAVPGGFSVDDFTVDEDTATVTCPAGQVRKMTSTRTVKFGKACATCLLRERCTTAKGGRSMSIHEHEALLRAARAQGRTPQFKQDYPTRSNIERTIAQTATQNGRRVKLRYKGAVQNNAWLRTRAAALNLRTLLKHGLTRTNGTWAIA